MRKEVVNVISAVLCAVMTISPALLPLTAAASEAVVEEEQVVEEQAERTEAGGLRFVNSITGEDIDPAFVTFDVPYETDGSYYVFPGLYVGDSISYTIEADGYEPVSGEYTLSEYGYDMVVPMEALLEESTEDPAEEISGQQEEEMELSVSYMEGSVRLDRKVPEGYEGAVYSLESGSDAVSVEEDGTLLIRNTGNAVISVQKEDRTLYVSLTVEKAAIGTIVSSDVEWDGLTKEEDGTPSFVISGTVSEDAGVRMDDTITVTATAEAASSFPGKHGSTLSDVTFEGAENYDIRLDGAGPEVTITEKENEGEKEEEDPSPETEKEEKTVSVTASFEDGGDASTGGYYPSDRIMTVRISAAGYDEEKTLFTVTADGEEMAGTVSDIREGQFEDVELVSEYLPGDDGAEYRILFGNKKEAVERSYEVGVSYDGTEASYCGASPCAFVIDEVAPVLEVAYKNSEGAQVAPGASADAPHYESLGMTVVLSVRDRFFDPAGISVGVQAADSEGVPTGAYPEGYVDAVKNSAWEEDDGVFTYTMEPFTAESNYVISAGYKDPAGNEAPAVQDGFFTIDRTAPEGGVSVIKSNGETMSYEEALDEKDHDHGAVSRFLRSVSGSRYVTLEDNYTDNMSGVSTAQYALAEDADSTTYENADWQDWDGSVRVDTEKVEAVLEKVTDRAGHTAYFSSGKSGSGSAESVNETAAPVITIGDAEDGSEAGTVRVSVTAEDPDNGGDGVYSGVNSITWTVTDSEGNEVLTDKVTAEGKEKKLEGTVTIPTEGLPSETVTVSVFADDEAGNTASAAKTLSVMTSDMQITTSMDMTGVQNEKFYNKARTLTVIFKGKDFDPEKASLSVKAGGQDASFTMAQLEAGGGADARIRFNSHSDSQQGAGAYTEDRTNTYELFFGDGADTDIDYEGILFAIKDSEGKEMQHAPAAGAFTVDMVAPVLVTAFTENGTDITEQVTEDAENARCGSLPVTLTASVTERSFDPKATVLAVTAKDSDGKAVEDAYPEDLIEQAKEDWTVSGTLASKQFAAFEKDANYSVKVQVADMAGNKSVEVPARYLSIDTACPEGTITVTADGRETEYTDSRDTVHLALASKNAFSITCEADDLTSGAAVAEYLFHTPDSSVSGDFTAETPESLAGADWTEWEKDKEGNLKALTLSPNRQAVLYVRITDKAGNTAFLHTDGMVADSAAPTAQLRLSGEDGAVFSDSFTAEVAGKDPEAGGTYSGVKNVKVRVTAKGNVVEEKTFNGADIKNRKQNVSGSFNIDAGKINTNDAAVTVTVTDNAGNTGRISTSLMVDSTDPVISTQMDTSDVKNGRFFNSTKTMTVTFTERNYDPRNAVMYLMDGNTRKAFSMSRLLNGAAEGYGIVVTGSSDSQEGWKVKDLTDDRKITYQIAFGSRTDEDTMYSDISFEVTDTAGNTAQHSPDMDTFTVDKVKPVIHVSYSVGSEDVTGSITTDDSTPYCTKQSVTASVRVEERNFYGDGMTAGVTAKDHDGGDTGAYSGADSIREGWRRENGMNFNTLPAFTADSNYGLSIECEDLAGNRAETYPYHYFTIDTTPPTGEIVVYDNDGSESYDHFTESAIFRHVSNAPITVARQARDATSGIASVRYYRYTPPVDASGQFAALSLEALRSVDWQEWGTDYTIEPDSQAVMYARLADRAGNILYLSTEGAMIADSTDPSYPDITITIGEPSEGIYNSDVPVEVYTQDPVSGGTYAGLRNVTVQVLNGGTVTQEASYTPGQKADRVRTHSASVTVDAERNNSNYVRVRVTAEDWAGNRSSAERELKIDITDPRIEVTYDRNDPANGRYYNSARTATVTVYERNFNPSRVNLSIGGASARISGWTIGSGAGSSDDNPNTCTIVFEQDSDYTFTMDLTDMAGNYASYGQTDSFTVDTTDPVITVTYDNNNGRGRYYNAPRTATIRVDEANFDPGMFTAQIQAMLEDRGIAAPPVIGWSASGDSHFATISFNTDGDYSFTLSCRDLAENPSQEYSSESFTIDLTAPAVAITGIKDKSANRGEASAVVEFSDLNFDPQGVVIRLSGLRHEARTLEGTFVPSAKGGTVTIPDFEHVITEDDVYTLTAIITDRAGNVTEKTITFSINRFGSNFYFNDQTKAHLKRYYEKESFPLVIYETNVNAIVDRDIIVYRNGETMRLDKKDFVVEDLSEKDDWMKYRYTVDESVFSEEGVYEVLVSSIDEAGNRQDNKTKDTPASFIIDKTAPSAVITGAEDGGIYNSTQRTVMVEVTDNYAVGSAEILVDGEVYGRYDAKSIGELDGKISVDIKESESWQTITASVIDAAGNENNADDMVILVTTDPITRLVNGTMFRTFVLGLMLLALVLMILFLIWKNRKKEENNTAAG